MIHRVLQIPPQTMNLCGLSQVILNWDKNINHSQVAFDYLCFVPPQKEVFPIIESMGGNVIIPPPNFSLKSAPRFFESLISSSHYDAIHVHTDPQASDLFQRILLNIAYQKNVPKRIVHSHNDKAKGLSWKGHLKFAGKRFFLNTFFPYKHLTHRFACSKLAGTALFGGYDFTILRNAVALDRFRFNPEARTRIRESYNIKDSDALIGQVGFICDIKNQSFSLHVLNALLKKNSKFKLCFVGAGDATPLKKLAASLNISDHVIFTGELLDPTPFYSAFDYFILPSFYEGFPLVGIEAQASGLPCVFSDSITDEILLTPNAVQKSLLSPVEAWTQFFLDTSLLSENARKSASSLLTMNEWSVDAVVKQLEKIYT